MKTTSFATYLQMGLIAGLVYGLFSLNEKLDGIKTKMDSTKPETVYQVVGKYHDEWAVGFVLKGNHGYRTVTYDRGSWFDNMEQTPEFVQVIEYENGQSPSIYPVIMSK